MKSGKVRQDRAGIAEVRSCRVGSSQAWLCGVWFGTLKSPAWYGKDRQVLDRCGTPSFDAEWSDAEWRGKSDALV